MTLKASALTIGQEFSAVVVDNLTRTQIVQYAGASGDYNPLHTDDLFAREVAGYPGVFAHGMLSMGATGRLITDVVGADRLRTYGVRFSKQVWPGDTLTATARVDGIRDDGGEHLVDLVITTVNQDGEVVVTGSATARIDP